MNSVSTQIALAKLHSIPSTVSPSKPASNPHVSYQDGLRGLAALFVVCHHMWQGPFGRLAHAGIKGLLCNWLLYGHLAVDAFIVLSGFCLVLPVAKSGTLNGGVWGFYARRARRILPPFYAVLLICVLLNYLTYRLGVHRPLVPMHTLIGNLLLPQDWMPTINMLDRPTWSVAAEWKIYFLFPLFIWVGKRFNAYWIIPTAAVIGCGSTLVYHLLRPFLNSYKGVPKRPVIPLMNSLEGN